MHRREIAAVIILGLLVISLQAGFAAIDHEAASARGVGRVAAASRTVQVPAAAVSGWTLLGTHSPPRDGHGFVYDSKADRFIVFGGAVTTSTFTNSTWSYDYATNTWADITPLTSPTPRAAAGMVYDSRADRIILFGGTTTPGAYSNETWVFDYANDTWTQKSPAKAPTGRAGAAMAYDARAARTILFGGVGLTGLFQDTWAYDLSTDTWVAQNVTSPAPLYLGSMVYSSSSHRDILFGGVTLTASTPVFHFDTWAFDYTNGTWTNRNPPSHPSARAGAAFAYDTASVRAILFGGTDSLTSLGPGGPFNDTWAYNEAQNQWANVTPVVSPTPRLLAAMDFDTVANRTVLFGGAAITGTPYNDTWAFALAASLPDAPRNLAAAAAVGRVTLTWQPPLSNGGSPITNYTIYRGTTSGAETLLATIGNLHTYADTSVTPGTTYYYEVAAITAVGEGPRSNEASATPLAPPSPPSAPQNLAASAGNAQVVLTWQTPASTGGTPITGYDVYRGPTSGGETLLSAVAVVLTYTDTSVTNGVTYYYEVSAVNGAGEGPKSNEVSATPAASPLAPSAPRSLVGTAGNAQVALTWQAPASDGGSSITNYKIYRGPSSGSEVLLTTVGAVLTYTDTSVTNGASYYYEVSAVNSAGEGPASNEVHATPVAPSQDTTPPSITINAPSNNAALSVTTVTVSGVASDNVALAKVELSTDNATWTLASGTTSWSGSVTLVEGANTIYARATDSSGNTRIAKVSVTVHTPASAPQGLDPLLLGGILVVVVAAALAVAIFILRRRKKATPPPPTAP